MYEHLITQQPDVQEPKRDSLESSIPILLPHLPSWLTSPKSVFGLEQIARQLPPITRGIFEVYFGSSDHYQIDLHQCVLSKRGDSSVLARYFAGQSLGDSWPRLQSFFQTWADSNHPIGKDVSELWLEWDNDSLLAAASLPSLFFDLPIDLPLDGLLRLIETTLVGLRGRQARLIVRSSIQQTLMAVAQNTSGKGRISHIGVMLPRPTDALRVNIKGLTTETLLPFLQAIEWPGDRDAAYAQMVWASGFVDHVTLALDMGETILPRLGLECFLIEQPAFEPRWKAWIDALTNAELCLPQECEALLAWPGITDPVHSSAPWPDHLILASLHHPAHEFSVIERKLNHIKLTLQESGELAAKGYLWFGERWINGNTDHIGR